MMEHLLHKAIILVAFFNITLSLSAQEIEKEIYSDVIFKGISQVRVDQLADHIDLSCGADIQKNGNSYDVKVLLSTYEIDMTKDMGYNPKITLHDKGKFAADRNRAQSAQARAELEASKVSPSTSNQRLLQTTVSNIGQYIGDSEIPWATPTNFNYGSQGDFYYINEIYAELDQMKSLYNNLITARIDMGNTIEGRDIYYVKISDNPDTDEKATEPQTLYTSAYHPREGITPMMNLFYMWTLLENYGTDAAITNIVDNHELYFILVVNPDGYVRNNDYYQATGNFLYQRKNMRNTSCGTNPTSSTSGQRGIDLNRNHAYNFNNGGASNNDGCSTTFNGASSSTSTAGFTEPETQAVRDLVLANQFQLALNHHSTGNRLYHAYAGVRRNPNGSGTYVETQTGFENEYFVYSQGFSRYNRFNHGPSTQIGSYNSGNANDWMISTSNLSTHPYYHTASGGTKTHQTLAWTPEHGTSGFWPPTSQFLPQLRNGQRMQYMAAYYSGKYALLHDITTDIVTTTSGNLNFSVERQGMTDGDFTLTVTSMSNGLTISNTTQTISGLARLDFQDVSFPYTIPVATADNTKFTYRVTLSNSDYILHEGIYTKIYDSSSTGVLASDDFSSGVSNWAMSSSGGGNWIATATGGYNNTGGMSNGASSESSVYATFNSSIDLSSIDSAVLQFKMKYDLERMYDYVQLEARTSTNTTWTPLMGKYTKPGSSTQSFATGEQIWGGDTRDNWVMEEIPLDDYTGGTNFRAGSSGVEFRFKYRNETNAGNDDALYNGTYEGVTIDEFRVLSLDESNSLTILPVEFTHFTAEAVNNSHVLLNWGTASEDNNDGFEVQTSTDGTTWKVLGFVAGNGTTDQAQSYSFVDESPEHGENFYRLRQVDFDGQSEFSDVQVAEITGEEVSVILKNNEVASLILPETMSFNYSVVNTVGEVVLTGDAIQASGSVDIDLRQLSNGIYYLQMISEKGTTIKTFPIRKIK